MVDSSVVAPVDAALSVRNLTVAYGSNIVVHDVSFEVAPGEIVALIGSSGAGKSSIIAAIMDLLPPEATSSGSISVVGVSRADVADGKWRNRVVGLIPQNPFSWFNPMIKVRKQIAEVAGRGRVAELLGAVGFDGVGLDDVSRVARSRPEQLSGGMRQRVAIAAALAHSPPLMLADEPTSALDPESQSHILELLRDCRARGQAVLLVSHDVAVVSSLADRLMYIHDGRLVPSPSDVAEALTERTPAVDGLPVLSVESLSLSFPRVAITSDFSMTVAEGETVAVVGPSGRGKSTLCRALVGLLSPRAGRVVIDGFDLKSLARSDRARAVQMVFQDVRGSLDERLSVRDCVELPLKPLGLSLDERKERAGWAFNVAGVEFHLRDRHAGELSGGEAQRVALARAIAIQSKVLILDEPFSALDLATRNSLVSRLIKLQEELGTSIVTVLHNDDVMQGFAHRVITLD